jgi:cytoskeleton-associated protein 5
MTGERELRTKYHVAICRFEPSKLLSSISLVCTLARKAGSKLNCFLAKFGDRVYDILSNAFDDPSATIVYPYVYRILNSGRTAGGTGDQGMSQAAETVEPSPRSSLEPPIHSRPVSEASSQVNGHRHSAGSPPTRNSLSSGANGHHSPLAIDDDPDAQLISIIHNISSETSGALHKEGITELHKFLKAYPHKKQKVDKLLEATGPAFRKYLARALASRAAEDEDRDAAVADTLSSQSLSQLISAR